MPLTERHKQAQRTLNRRVKAMLDYVLSHAVPADQLSGSPAKASPVLPPKKKRAARKRRNVSRKPA